MLNRYETGPIATVLVIATALALCAFDIFDALRFHHKMGWLNAAGPLSSSSSFTNVSGVIKTS